jgi:hypothetical protein
MFHEAVEFLKINGCREQAREQPVNKMLATDFFCVQLQTGTVLEFRAACP